MRTKIFKLANFLHYQKGLTRSEALKKAWKVIRLKEAMRSDQVEFSFVKKDGTTRHAIGTLQTAVVSPKIKGTGRPYPINQIRYFDIDRAAFRSFNAETLI
jgi:hypothetical protein